MPRSASLSPKEYLPVVPARQAYSHSASEDKRTTLSKARSRRFFNSRVILLQKRTASFQLTISTELRGPFHLLGFLPAINSYNSWVTSNLPMEKEYAKVTLWAGCSAAGPVAVPIVKLAGYLSLPGVKGMNSSMKRLRIFSALSAGGSPAFPSKAVRKIGIRRNPENRMVILPIGNLAANGVKSIMKSRVPQEPKWRRPWDKPWFTIARFATATRRLSSRYGTRSSPAAGRSIFPPATPWNTSSTPIPILIRRG